MRKSASLHQNNLSLQISSMGDGDTELIWAGWERFWEFAAWSFYAAISLCSILMGAGCTAPMIMSYPSAGHPRSPVPAETQTAGTYFLVKHHLVVTVTRRVRVVEQEIKTIPDASQTTKVQIRLADPPDIDVKPKAVPDKRQLIETGLLLSPNSLDDIKVTVDDNGLLLKVSAVADDKSKDVLETIVKTVSSPLFRDAKIPDEILFETEFDPFDPRESREINAYLFRRFRSCIEVEVEPGRWSPGCPLSQSLNRKKFDLKPPEITVPSPGIYYRRPIAHRVHITSGGRTKKMTMENFSNWSPLLRLDIDRTTFVRRETTIVVEDGVPTSIQVKKNSEALEVASLPLKLAAAPIAAVTEAFNTRQKVYDAETNLLNAQASALKNAIKLQDLQGKNPGLSSGLVRSGSDSLAIGEIRARCAQLRLSLSDCLAAQGQ